jgi:hypothetical protein
VVLAATASQMRTGDRFGYNRDMRFEVQPDGRLPDSDMGGTWVLVEDAALPRPLHLRVAALDDGRLICTGLLVDSTPDRELTARDLRKIPLAEILTTLAKPRKRRWLGKLLGHGDEDRTGQQRQTQTWQSGYRVERVRRARPGRGGYPDDHYRQVAKEYRRAKLQHPRAPIQALISELHVSEPTVHRWLNSAAQKGFLKEEER